MRKFLPIIFIVFFGTVGLIFAFTSLGSAGDDTFSPSTNKRVRVFQVAVESIQSTYEYSGYVRASKVTDVASEVSGRVEWVGVEVGDAVKKGEVIARLDASTEEIKLALARATSKNQQTTYQEAKRFYDQLVEEAKANLDKAEELYEQAKKSSNDDAKDTAKDNRDIAREQLESARKSRAFQMSIEHNAVDSSELTAEINESIWAKTVLIAPYDGIITDRFMDEGAVVGFSAPVVRIVNSKGREVELWIAEESASDIAVGSEVVVHSRDIEVSGSVCRITPAITENTRKVGVVMCVDSEELPIGAFVSVEIFFGAREELAVPVESLVTDRHDTVVFTVSDGVARRQVVEVGEVSGDRVSVLDGLNPGDYVVTSGQYSLFDGDNVKTYGE